MTASTTSASGRDVPTIATPASTPRSSRAATTIPAVPFAWMSLWFGYRLLPLVIWPRSHDDRTLLERLIDWNEDRRLRPRASSL
jgi:hypothetical protein